MNEKLYNTNNICIIIFLKKGVDRMIESIKNLIDLMNNNVITAYKVSKETGVSQHRLSQLKCGKIKVENLRIVTGIKLEKYYRSLNQ